MRIKCVITDDEPMARKGLQSYAEKIDILDLVAVCENALELNSVLQSQQVDLVFLDIEMPQIRGTDFVKTLPDPPLVVFTTAYERYAVEGFELDVLDYLLKPVSFERFLRAVNKARQFMDSRRQSVTGDYLFIKVDHKLEKVIIEDILFAEAMENYVAIYTQQQKMITLATMKSLVERLPAEKFIQPHKSYIVGISKINSIEGNIIHIGKYQVPVSKYQKEEVLERIVNAKLLRK
jgi:DNA-binding LytR/AlgR family response regulator